MSPRFLDAPLAITTDGMVVANATQLFGDVERDDPRELLDAALSTGRPVLVAVTLDRAEVEGAKGRIEDAAAEIVATVVRL